MPTHTPSPHRFLAPASSSTQKAKLKQPSSLRHAQPQTPKPTCQTPSSLQTIKSELQSKTLTPAKRFITASTPHSRNAHENTTPRPNPRRKLERIESIEEARSSPPDITSHDLDDSKHEVVHSIEEALYSTHHHHSHNPDLDDEEMLFNPPRCNKRLRLSPPHTPAHVPIASTSKSTSKSITSPAPPPPHTHLTNRPAFILPLPTSPLTPQKPLPEVFSPSRKTARYTPAGLASTVSAWIIETANTGAGMSWAREPEDGVRLRVRITAISGCDRGEEMECLAGGVVFVRGHVDRGLGGAARAHSFVGEEGEMRVLLSGQGGTRGATGVKICVGGLVGIKAPTWDVEIQDERWVVGVEWNVLS